MAHPSALGSDPPHKAPVLRSRWMICARPKTLRSMPRRTLEQRSERSETKRNGRGLRPRRPTAPPHGPTFSGVCPLACKAAASRPSSTATAPPLVPSSMQNLGASTASWGSMRPATRLTSSWTWPWGCAQAGNRRRHSLMMAPSLSLKSPSGPPKKN